MTSRADAWPLLPYQARWVADPAPVKIVEKTRRCGISWAESYDSTLHAAAGRGSVAYISFSKDMTRGFIRDCAEWARVLGEAASEIDEELIEDEGRDVQTFAIRFPNGTRIEALSSAPRQLRSRGRPGDRVIIDEAAFVSDVDALLKAAMAYRIWGGSVHIISTHNGAANPFAELVEDVREGRQPFSLHRITLAGALADGLYRRICEVSGRAWSPEGEREWEAALRADYRHDWAAAEELDCVPAAGGGAWIALEDYLACEEPDAGRPALYAMAPCFAGYDVARRRDLAVQCVLERVAGRAWLREMAVYRDRPFHEQYAGVDSLMSRYRIAHLHVDQTGMGEAVVEELQRRHGAYRVRGVQMSGGRPLELATALREAFEARAIAIPANDRTLRADVRSIRRAPSAGGAPRLVSEGKDTDGHADRFWALALAWRGIAEVETVYEVIRARPGARHDGPIRGRSGTRLRSLPGGAL